MNIQEIKERVELFQKATCQKTVLVSDIAKELKCRITDLMKFIIDNPKLFNTEEVWTLKNETYYEYVCGSKHKYTRQVKDKCKGLGIECIYLSPEENWRTDEWAEKQKKDFENTFWVSKWNNYGVIEGMYVDNDKEDKMRHNLWRNTPEKIEKLKEQGILFRDVFYIGGLGDCSAYEKFTAINEANIKKAKELGWNVEYL